jgi:pyridoxine 4-dehydrogenase
MKIKLEGIKCHRKVSPTALRTLCKRSPVVLPIPWTSQVSHLDENVAAAALELTPYMQGLVT